MILEAVWKLSNYGLAAVGAAKRARFGRREGGSSGKCRGLSSASGPKWEQWGQGVTKSHRWEHWEMLLRSAFIHELRRRIHAPYRQQWELFTKTC